MSAVFNIFVSFCYILTRHVKNVHGEEWALWECNKIPISPWCRPSYPQHSHTHVWVINIMDPVFEVSFRSSRKFEVVKKICPCRTKFWHCGLGCHGYLDSQKVGLGFPKGHYFWVWRSETLESFTISNVLNGYICHIRAIWGLKSQNDMRFITENFFFGIASNAIRYFLAS